MRIAIIEDNENIARGIAYRLEDRGHATDILGDGLAADAFLKGDGNDIIVLDINLPGLSGLEVLRNLRRRGDARPVLLLTARGEAADMVAGLDAGADDYLAKPFSMDVLEARLRALSRRRAQAISDMLELGALAFDATLRSASVAGEALDLPRREMSLLEALMEAEGRTVSKERLLERLYGAGAEVEDSAIEVHVSRLRKRLKPHGFEIAVQRGLGYRLAEAQG
jgi:DNA-binding response OmpR family regulator